MSFKAVLYELAGKSHAISLQNLAEMLFRFISQDSAVDKQLLAEAIWRDYQRGGRSDRPAFLADYVPASDTRMIRPKKAGPTRQARHLSVSSPDAV